MQPGKAFAPMCLADALPIQSAIHRTDGLSVRAGCPAGVQHAPMRESRGRRSRRGVRG